MARQTRSGVSGIRMSLTPRCRTASRAALTTAGVLAMQPASPTPLAPSGLLVASCTVLPVSKWGGAGGGGRKLVAEAAGGRFAVGVVVPLLEHGLGDALGQPAVDLPLDDQRVD